MNSSMLIEIWRCGKFFRTKFTNFAFLLRCFLPFDLINFDFSHCISILKDPLNKAESKQKIIKDTVALCILSFKVILQWNGFSSLDMCNMTRIRNCKHLRGCIYRQIMQKFNCVWFRITINSQSFQLAPFKNICKTVNYLRFKFYMTKESEVWTINN